MKWILWIFVALAGFLILITLIGWLLPKDHVATRQGRYRQPPEAIWKAITDVDAMPSWREGLKSVKHLPHKNGLPAHLEITNMGEIPMETVEMTPPRKLVGRIADRPFRRIIAIEIRLDAARGHVKHPVSLGEHVIAQ